MLDVLVKSAVRRKLLGFFAINPSEEFYPRQVAQELEESPHAVGLEIKYLVKNGLLEKVKTKQGIYYKWNARYPYATTLQSVISDMRRQQCEEMLFIPLMQWRRHLNEEINMITDALIKGYAPEKIILFGSAVSGKSNPDSDVDIFIIKRTDLKPLERIRQLSHILPRNRDVAVDCVVWTPEEVDAASGQNLFLKNEILKKGKVLYERKC